MARKRKYAYYSRNNSYSRSYNAEQAEREGRFPLTRAAKVLGIAPTAFKNGCRNAGITTNEWHHVGKYASRIDYWDSNEIKESIEFWHGAMNRKNQKYCSDQIQRIRNSCNSENPIKTRQFYNLFNDSTNCA